MNRDELFKESYDEIQKGATPVTLASYLTAMRNAAKVMADFVEKRAAAPVRAHVMFSDMAEDDIMAALNQIEEASK